MIGNHLYKMWRWVLAGVYTSVLWYSRNHVTLLPLALATFFFLLSLLGPHYLWLIYATSSRDTRALYRYLRLRFRIRRARSQNQNVPKVFQENVQKSPDKVAFYFDEEKWTFAQVEEYSNRVANYFKSEGFKQGDSVALMMLNSVEYVGIWLGLAKIGVIPALINYNLRSKSLVHCITIVECKAVICGPEFQAAVDEISKDLGNLKTYVGCISKQSKFTLSLPGAADLEESFKKASTSCPPEIHNINFKDKLVFIYTSGTTGLPKAAVITHSRAIFASIGMFSMVGLTSEDIIYDPLPLYHTLGGIVGIGMCLFERASIATRNKFSASSYWVDCVKYNCTVAQYIGEICRYLLNTPPKPEDTQHKVRVMFGNGLRPQLWPQFQERFRIEQISEFYGATEGNANIINMDGKQGAIGFLSVLLPSFYPCCLIKIDEDTGKPLRNSRGLCIRCEPGEPGEFVGKIVRNDPVRDFHGYADKKATESKIVRDVWKKGDLAFLSGDILVMDEEGYLYFKDRRGDTFRWRGENVSTTEVEGVLSQIVEMTDVVVYGVEVPGAEGRAGMAAILDPDQSVDLNKLAKGYASTLPAYAQPLFVRLVPKLDMTGTYKLKKGALQKEGFDLNVVKDKIFFLDQKASAYLPLTKELFNKILKEEMRL